MATQAAKPARPRKPRSRRVDEPCPETPDPIDLAMAAASSGKPLPAIAHRVLEEHAELIHAQRAELKLRKVGEGVRAALWAILAIFAAALLVTLAAVVLRAMRSDALIVQSFDVPAQLEARGLTGKVVATKVLDRLAELQQQTQSIRAASSYANNWQDELSIDIPNTNATTDQIWTLLRAWLGKETRISGEIVETGGGLALTARVGASAGRTFVSPEGNLNALISQGAELIYEQTQPYRYATFLNADPARRQKGRALLLKLARSTSAMDRKWAFNGLAVAARTEGKPHEAIAFSQRAIAVDETMLPAHANLALARQSLGHEQASLDTSRKLLGIRLSDEFDPAVARTLLCVHTGHTGAMLPDPVLAGKAASCLSTSTTVLGGQQEVVHRANHAWLRHEPYFNVTVPPAPDDSPVQSQLRTAFLRLRGEVMVGGRSGIERALATHKSLLAEQLKAGQDQAGIASAYPTVIRPVHARALARLGRYDEARAVIEPSPLDCYECLRVRGLVAEGLGNPLQAQRWYAEAVRQGPDIARAYVDWARLLAKHRRFEAAELRFTKAAEIAPNWADPLKYWGDALASQGKTAEALEKYDDALKRAPKWKELRQARARLASR